MDFAVKNGEELSILEFGGREKNIIFWLEYSPLVVGACRWW